MRRFRYATHGTACVTLTLLLAVSEAHAQTPAETGVDNGREIVVTAEKRATRSRDVPGGISALDDTALKEARINNLEDATRLVPGFEFGKASAFAFPVIRGVSPQIVTDPTVAMLRDGFGFANDVRSGSEEIFDPERIEILKGPQATLYGANSLGGVINVISKLPSLTEYEGDFRLSYGTYDSAFVRGAVSVPIVDDSLAIRVGGYIRSRDGYWDNLFNGKQGQDAYREKGARFVTRFNPSDAFHSALIYNYSYTGTDCADCAQPFVGFDPTPPTGERTIKGSDLGAYTNTNIPGYYVRKMHRVTWDNDIDLGGVRLAGLTGYGEAFNGTITDLDRGPGDTLFPDIFVERKSQVFSQEVRLASDGTGPLNWQVGGFFMQSNENSVSSFITPVTVTISSTRNRFKNFALFTHNSYSVTDQFDVTFGLRFDYAKKSSLNKFTGAIVETDSKAWLPKLAALYKIDDATNIYATVSRGYKTGGTNTPLPGIPSSYKPEFLWNYEIGLKGVSADRKLRYDLAAFFINWKDQQVQQTAAEIFGYIANAAKSRIYGMEAALHYDVTDQLSFDVGAAYTHARYLNYYDNTFVPIFFGRDPDLSGERMFFSPDWSGNIAGRYVHPIGGGFDVTFAGDARYTGKRTLDPSAVFTGEAFVLANFSLSIGDEQKRLTLFANNAFDKRYNLSNSLVTGIVPVGHLGPPRIVGIQADFSF